MDNSQPSSGCQLPTEVAIGDHGGGGAGAVASGDNANVSSAEGPSILQPAETWAGNGRRPLVFDKMESLVREMQDPENGVPVRSQKLFLTSIPSAFMGYDLIEWLMERLNIEDSVEAIHTANLLCQHGYFFPVGDCKSLTVKDDSSLYRFQTPYYWPSQNHNPENSEYVIYLYKRSLRNKQKHGLEDYEAEALSKLKKQLAHKWEFIVMQAEEQVRLAKDRKKGDKIVTDSQERAYWRAYRPPPGFLNCLESPPYPNLVPGSNASSSSSSSGTTPGTGLAVDAVTACQSIDPPRQWRSCQELKAEVEYLRSQLVRARIKVSVAAETLQQHSATYAEYDPFLPAGAPQPSNPWLSDDPTYWAFNAPIVELPTEKRAKKWAISIEDLVSDQTGLQELTNYLRKEYSHENIRFWLATNQLRSGPASAILQRVQEIYQEFLAPGAPCEINIDGRTMDRVQQEMRRPSRFTFDQAAEHVYNLLLKKDCYPRFVRSEHYRQLLLNALQPSQKKRFFNFGNTGKKKSISAASSGVVPAGCIQTQLNQAQVGVNIIIGSASTGSTRRRGSNGGGLGVMGGGMGADRSPSNSPPDHQLLLQQPGQSGSGSLLLASSSATTAAASAGINAANPSGIQHHHQSSSSPANPGSSGDDCDTPYRGDMPGTLHHQRPWSAAATPQLTSGAAGISSGAQPLLPTPPTPLTPPPPPPPPLLQCRSLSSCSSESPPVFPPPPMDDVCPWESVEPPPVTTATSSTGRTTSRFLSVDLPSSGQDPVAQPKRSSLCVDITGRPVVEGGRPHLRGGKPSAATEADVCPWESVLPPGASSPRSSGGGRSSAEESRKSSTEVVDADPVCPWESMSEPARKCSTVADPVCPWESQEPPPAIRPASETVLSTSASGSVGDAVPNLHPSHSPSGSRKESMTTTAASAGDGQQQQPATGKISDICPWEDEESCKMDQPFVKTYATLGYL